MGVEDVLPPPDLDGRIAGKLQLFAAKIPGKGVGLAGVAAGDCRPPRPLAIKPGGDADHPALPVVSGLEQKRRIPDSSAVPLPPGRQCPAIPLRLPPELRIGEQIFPCRERRKRRPHLLLHFGHGVDQDACRAAGGNGLHRLAKFSSGNLFGLDDRPDRPAGHVLEIGGDLARPGGGPAHHPVVDHRRHDIDVAGDLHGVLGQPEGHRPLPLPSGPGNEKDAEFDRPAGLRLVDDRPRVADKGGDLFFFPLQPFLLGVTMDPGRRRGGRQTLRHRHALFDLEQLQATGAIAAVRDLRARRFPAAGIPGKVEPYPVDAGIPALAELPQPGSEERQPLLTPGKMGRADTAEVRRDRLTCRP